jgi:aldose 1-epimerase
MIAETEFGTLQSQKIRAITISNVHGLSAKLITFGARLAELHVPDRNGRFGDIVLGFDTIAEYDATATFFAATCGRYGNRIARGQFMIDRVQHQLSLNEGKNHLHGGKTGFDRKVWGRFVYTGGQQCHIFRNIR